jgi:ubiquinone/menaquinone biosynthesis C-methylase UbiE
MLTQTGSETMEDSSWLDAETARRYQDFTEKTTMYQDLSRALVRLAEVKPGMTLLDLGCGTGITSQIALEALGDKGHVYALDFSPAMLAYARQRLPAEQVTLINADAVELEREVNEPIDLVLCNSVFWQLRHKPPVMAALRNVLKPDGLFIFNAPETYFIMDRIPHSSKVAVLFKQLAAERYGFGTQDLRTMEVFLKNHGFELVTTEIVEQHHPAEESYLFSQIPVATAWMEPPLDYETRMALLEEAWRRSNREAAAKRRWIYVVAQPRK